MPDQPNTPRAVFISYAREDADAARRIADALRAFEVEVWFDQNELRGGDAWDQKIRSQIRTCTLCIPVISATTQSRGEGYFRREWKIAVERLQDMAVGVPFLLPVVIDDTKESEATVPEEFMRLQWTRLPRGVPTPQFVEQVRMMLEKPRTGVTEPGRTRPAAGGAAVASPGRRGFPSLAAAVVVALVVGVGAAYVFLRKPAPEPAQEASPARTAGPVPAVSDRSIAVLPFTNMSEDKDSGFFADGVHEDILTKLALVRELRVVSRTSVMPYRTTSKSMRQIAQELGVAYILEGSVRRSGNKVRVTGQLIHAATDEHIWAQAYDRDLTDVFGIQAELSQEIATALKAALSPEEKVLLAHRPTENTAAYDLFLRFRDTHNREGNEPAALHKQETLLQSAVDLDPAFASAWGELAVVHALYSFWGHDASEARLAKAKTSIDNAVRLAPESPDVIRSLGTYRYYCFRDYEGAARQYEKLARLQPNDPTVFSSLGLIQRRQGNWADSLANLRRATQLDPANASYARNLISQLDGARRYGEEEAERRRLVALVPEQLDEAVALATLPLVVTGSTQEGDAFFARLPPAVADSPRGIEARKAWAWSKGDFAEGIRLDRLQPYFDEDGRQHYFQAYFAALNLAASGDLPGARARLENFPEELRARLEREPNNWQVFAFVGIFEAFLDHHDEALRYARQAVALMPESRDALDGPVARLCLCYAYAWTGEKDLAVAEVAHLLRTPHGVINVHQLRLAHSLRPLEGDPRYEALLNDPANNAPLF